MAEAQFENEAIRQERIKEETTKQTVSPIKSFLSGGFGGMSAVLVGKFRRDVLVKKMVEVRRADKIWMWKWVGHPFDLTKTRLQTAAPGSYTGAIDVVKKTLARDGVKGYAASSRLGPFL
jgi:solute carrier family 25 carnitine/acylcarnitine transporter 20/29